MEEFTVKKAKDEYKNTKNSFLDALDAMNSIHYSETYKNFDVATQYRDYIDDDTAMTEELLNLSIRTSTRWCNVSIPRRMEWLRISLSGDNHHDAAACRGDTTSPA